MNYLKGSSFRYNGTVTVLKSMFATTVSDTCYAENYPSNQFCIMLSPSGVNTLSG